MENPSVSAWKWVEDGPFCDLFCFVLPRPLVFCLRQKGYPFHAAQTKGVREWREGLGGEHPKLVSVLTPCCMTFFALLVASSRKKEVTVFLWRGSRLFCLTCALGERYELWVARVLAQMQTATTTAYVYGCPLRFIFWLSESEVRRISLLAL